MKKLILGSPGCGKTTELINIVEQELASGVKPERIAFLSFTKAGAVEAMNRAVAKFGLSKTRFTYFRTIHSLGYHEVGAHASLMRTRNYRELGDMLNIRFTGYYEESEVKMFTGEGDKIKFVEEQARITLTTLEDAHRKHAPTMNMFRITQYKETLDAYKVERKTLDFTDLLTEYIDHGDPLDVDVFILDEAQDLSKLQWQMCNKAMRNAKRVYIAGDDDQAIHKWCGADVKTFLNLDVDEVKVLEKTWRLPPPVHELAQKIASRITTRYEKDWHADPDKEGKVQPIFNLRDIAEELSTGTWLLLARNVSLLAELEEDIRSFGYHYTFRGKKNKAIAHLSEIITWERLRKGESQKVWDVQKVYDLIKVRTGVKHGMKQIDADRNDLVTIDDLINKYGLTTNQPWFNVLNKIASGDIEYLRACLGRKEKLSKKPRIEINTIHSVKGMEADNVVIRPDMVLPTFKGYCGTERNSEHRVFYVGVTRAKENLYVMHPERDMYYPIL